MTEVKSTLQGHSTGVAMSIQRNRWSSKIPKPVSGHSGHGWMSLLHVNLHHDKKSKELGDNNPSKNDRKDP